MPEWIIKKFIKDYKNIGNIKVHNAYGKFAGVVGIICNIFLFAIKILAGTLFNSVSVTADAVNNLSDASSSVVSLMGFKLSEKPADEEHPYGHGRYEYLSGLIVAVMIMVIGVELLKSGVERVFNPSAVEFSVITVCVLCVSIAVKLWMAFFNYSLGKKINSGTLKATGSDSRNDVIATSAVLAAAVISYFTGIELDGFMGIAVSVFILYSGVGIIRETLDPLLGRAPDKSFVEKIRNRILSYPGVLGTHDLLVHDYGPGRKFASVHVEMSADDDVIASHDVIDNIERDFLQDGLHMVVHFDPIDTSDGKTSELRKWIADKVCEIDENLSIHDLRIIPGVTHTNIIFDCVVPFDCNLTDAMLTEKINEAVRKKYPDFNCVITFDKSYAAIPH